MFVFNSLLFYHYQIGDYLLTLPQQLEPFITQENPALEVAMKAGNLPFPDLEGLYELLHVTSLYMVHTLFTGSHYDHEVDLSLQITHPAQERLATSPGSTSVLFSNSGVGSFTSHKNRISKSAMRRNLRFADVARCHYKGSAFFTVI